MRHVSIQKFADECRVSRSAVAAATAPGYSLNGAMGGDRGHYTIDTEHPAAIAYGKKHHRGVHPDAQPRDLRLTKQPDWPDDIAPYMDLTLATMISRHGSLVELKAFLDAGLKITKIMAEQFRIDAGRGKLISRDLVQKHVVARLDDSLSRMLLDAPVTIVPVIREMIVNGKNDETIIPVVQDALGQHIRGLKKRATDGLQAVVDQCKKVEDPE